MIDKAEGTGANLPLSGDEAPARRVRSRRRRPSRRTWIIGGTALTVVAGAAVLIALVAGPRHEQPRVINIGETAYTTNVEVRAEGGYTYVYLPVNTDVADVILEVDDAADRHELRTFLDAVDTNVPGEHVVDLTNTHVRVIVDGMAENQ